MKKIISALLLSLILYNAAAQRVYFVYLQTENNQPFFVKLNEKLHSSTASGYLILSRLRDSSYSFSVGFPGNSIREQQFSVTIGQKDHGYLIKNFGEKGWGLFNLQTLAVQMAATAKTTTHEKPVTGSKDVSDFTDILSKASDDPSLKEKPVPRPPVEEKKEPVVTAVKEEVKIPKKDTAVVPAVVTPTYPVVKTENKPVEVKEPPVIVKPDTTIVTAVVKKEEPPAEPVQKAPPVTIKPDSTVITAVVKKEEQPSEPVQKAPPVTVKADSTVTTAVIKKEEPPAEPVKKEPVNTDTVALVKPAPLQEEPAKDPVESPASEEAYKKSVVLKRSESSTTEGFGLVFLDQYDNGMTDTIRLLIPNPKTPLVPVKEEVKEEKKFLDISSDTAKKTTESDPAQVAKPAPKNDCPGVAGESDFLKLRKKMAAADNDEEMLTEARKYFKQKCFTVEQLKNLSTLFLKDAGKYNFFDAGYLYAADTANFATLQAELKEEYYINRFKAMLRN